MITYQTESWDSYYRDSAEINQADYDEIWPHKEKMPLKPNVPVYQNLEIAGMLLICTVRDGAELIGFHITIISPSTHSADTLCGFQDACYLHKKYRGVIGIKLLKFAELQTKKRGVQMMIWSTPESKSSGRILESMGFTQTDTVYCKWVGA